MLHEQFELKNAANTVETAASSSKMLQIPPTCCKFYGKWEVSTPNCCKDSWNGSFQLQNAAAGKENVQKKRIQFRSLWKNAGFLQWFLQEQTGEIHGISHGDFQMRRVPFFEDGLWLYNVVYLLYKISIVYLLYIYYDFDILYLLYI